MDVRLRQQHVSERFLRRVSCEDDDEMDEGEREGDSQILLGLKGVEAAAISRNLRFGI